MRKLVFIFVITNLICQDLPPQSDIIDMTVSEKLVLYNQHDKSIPLAMTLNLAPFPSVGFAYIKDWKKGLLYDTAYMINLAILAYLNSIDVLSDEKLGNMLVITNISLYSYKSYDLFNQTKEYNNNLFKLIMGEDPN